MRNACIRSGSLATAAVVLFLAGSIARPRPVDGSPTWDAALGAYVTGNGPQLVVWRMRDGKPAEAAVHTLFAEWQLVYEAARYEPRVERVEVEPGRFEDRTVNAFVAFGHHEWRKDVPFIHVHTPKWNAGKLRRTRQPADGGVACGAACGGGGVA